MRPEELPIVYTSVENPQWTDSSRTSVICSVQFDHLADKVEFVASAGDRMTYGAEIYSRAISGEFGSITPASPARLADLPPTEPGVAYLVGDVLFLHPNLTLQSYIKKANLENHLGSETGTVIAWTNILDKSLEAILVQNGDKADGVFNNRIEWAFAKGLIGQDERGLLHQVRKIRNAFGHEVLPSLDEEPLKSKCELLYLEAIGDAEPPSNRFRFLASCVELFGRISPDIC